MKKTRQLMNELGYTPDASAAAMYFLTEKLNEKDVAALRKAIPRKDLVENWHNLEDDAKALAKRLNGKDAATPSRTWKLLSESRPDLILFLDITSRQSSVTHKIKNFFTKWREVRKRVPLPEMTELRITPQMPEYAKIADDVFMLLLDGKMRSQTEIMKYLKPLAPPPPPPPPPPPAKRGRGAKAAGAQAGNAPGKAGKKGKAAPVVAVPPTVEVKAAKPLEKVPEPPPVRVAQAKVVKQPAKPVPTKDKKKKTKGKAR
jgi:hypothetical protein